MKLLLAFAIFVLPLSTFAQDKEKSFLELEYQFANHKTKIRLSPTRGVIFTNAQGKEVVLIAERPLVGESNFLPKEGKAPVKFEGGVSGTWGPQAQVTFVVTTRMVYAIDENGSYYEVIPTLSAIHQGKFYFRPELKVVEYNGSSYRFVSYEDHTQNRAVIRYFKDGIKSTDTVSGAIGRFDELKTFVDTAPKNDFRITFQFSTGEQPELRSCLLSEFHLGVREALKLHASEQKLRTMDLLLGSSRFFEVVKGVTAEQSLDQDDQETIKMIADLPKQAKDPAKDFAVLSGIRSHRAQNMIDLFANGALPNDVSPYLIEFHPVDNERELYDYLDDAIKMKRVLKTHSVFFLFARPRKVYDLIYIPAGKQDHLQAAITNCNGANSSIKPE